MNQKLVAAEILAAPFAERRDQVRRLYFDLTGLPPSPQALKEMLTAADFESSYRKLVDDLLASPHYGETFARRWMDVARYAEWGGEFGRTPYSEGKGTGRDHNPGGFTVWVAGGGFKSGYAYGETDEFGFRGINGRVHMHDLHATLLHQLGLDHKRLTYKHAGRDFRLTDVHGHVVHEIIDTNALRPLSRWKPDRIPQAVV